MEIVALNSNKTHNAYINYFGFTNIVFKNVNYKEITISGTLSTSLQSKTEWMLVDYLPSGFLPCQETVKPLSIMKNDDFTFIDATVKIDTSGKIYIKPYATLVGGVKYTFSFSWI